jgi:hypothetical protein
LPALTLDSDAPTKSKSRLSETGGSWKKSREDLEVVVCPQQLGREAVAATAQLGQLEQAASLLATEVRRLYSGPHEDRSSVGDDSRVGEGVVVLGSGEDPPPSTTGV